MNFRRIAAEAAAIVLLTHAGAALAQVHKCPGPDGQQQYSDKPCAGAVAPKSQPIAPREPARREDSVAFSGDATVDLITASALIDNMRTLGRDCEWALKVQRDKIDACRVFLAKVSPGGQLSAIAPRVREIAANPSMTQTQLSELQRVNRTLLDVLRYKEFATANLASR